MNMIIRNEKEEDYRAVEELTREAFWNLYVPGCAEHFVLHSLRNSRDFIPELDFIAEKEGQIVGQIAYSRGVGRLSTTTQVKHGLISAPTNSQTSGLLSAR